MQKLIVLFSFVLMMSFISAQQTISVGQGSYAEFPPEAVAYEDGYFAAPYKWFEMAWPELNLHEHARNRPLPTNKWWTEFLFRGLGKVQPEYHQPPLTLTTTGNRFGCEAWAYPYMLTASPAGFNVFYPQGFSGGGMIKGNPLKVYAATQLQANDENILFADFETVGWSAGWTITNNTKSIPGPMATNEITQSPKPQGYTGNRFVNTYKGDDARISIVSPVFSVQKKFIRLLAGGGNHPDDTYVGLFINGVKVRNATGENSGNLKKITWDVTEYSGQQAEIRIVDNSSGGWGFIMCDEIIFTDSELGGSGYTADFNTSAAKVYDWSDLGFTLRSESNGNYMDATMIHGVPFAYFEYKDLFPILSTDGNAVVYDASGQIVTDFPATMNVLAIESDNKVFGVHLPAGSILHKSNGGDFQIEFQGDKKYVVVSVLPNRSLLTIYDQYARNKPRDVRFESEYQVSAGKVVTKFVMNTTHLDNGNKNGEILMALMPHHYRTATLNCSFISGADYPMFRGLLKTASASTFEISYDFGGMPPYLPEPVHLTTERRTMLNDLLTYSSQHYTINGNTYAKGLGESSTMMLMAKSMGHSGYELFKNNLKNELSDWFTFSASEQNSKQRYFANYPDYGAMIGFAPGYGSQGFNDLHFHNGYFIAGAARLMLVDPEFKRDFAGITKLVAQNYANWDRWEDTGNTYMPYLRTFDPYFGHSFAGGTGDGGGNNQESTSEAINSWFGLYLMGLALNDKQITDAGITGYLLETITAGEYWLDLYGDNFSPTYNHDYVGILRTDNLAWATYFAGDPAWVLGIQACPADFYYRDFWLKPERMTAIQQSMFHDRTTFIYDGNPMHTNDDPYDNIKTMGPYLGGYHLNIMNYTNPVDAAQWIDDFCRLPDKAGQDWRNHLNTTTNYYLSNAMIDYGNPAEGYHTSIPSGAVYKNSGGQITYLLYNAENHDVNVDIYQGNTIIETIRVGAGKYYNSAFSGVQIPIINNLNYRENDKLALNKKVTFQANATDKDGTVVSVKYYVDETLIGTGSNAGFDVPYTPEVPGVKTLTAIAVDDEGNESEPYIITIEVLNIEQSPFNGTAWNIPADKILAVQFDIGGPEISCHDNEIEMQGGNNYRAGTGIETEDSNNGDGNIGWTNAGEWMEYTVYATKKGTYAMYSRLSSAGGGALRIFIDGVDKTGSAIIATTGSWGNYQDVHVADIYLTEDEHIMRVMIDKTGMNLSSYSFNFISEDNITNEVENLFASSIKIAPNPFDDILSVYFNDIEIASAQIITLTGKIIHSQTGINKSNILINTGSLSDGYYLLRITTSEGEVINTKIFKR